MCEEVTKGPKGAMTGLSDERKWRIIFVHERTRSVTKTAQRCKCTRATVRKWVERHNETGTVDAKRSTGRPAAVLGGAGLEAAKLLAGGQHGGAKQVSMALRSQGHTRTAVHKTTLIRAARREAKRAGTPLVVRRGAPPRGLTAKTMDKRLKFAEKNRRRDWTHVMFSDRKRFYFRYPGQSVSAARWEMEGAEQGGGEVWSPNNPNSYNVYGGITVHGVTRLHEVAGSTGRESVFRTLGGKEARNITTDEYSDVLEQTLLPGGETAFGRQWVFQQDGDPAHGHAIDVLNRWNSARRARVSLLEEWPGNSPDLNLIENVWSWVQANVDKKGCSTFKEFKKEVRVQFAAVPQSMLTSLYSSMPKRLDEVIKNGGRRTKY